ncbi:MAG: hypothetical protein A3J24_02155 [Deltaproteobacteria bacterium RIFCSPLOWO2_02_FULL_53_8]|nr:MAG: hypothetical protein A3J24_02155 [Deltaproteobacteria bacterium RIFCSPLOWO2_02_FULL_53_8]
MSTVIKNINGKEYAYIAYRSGRKVVQRYIGPVSSPATKARLEAIASQKAVPQEFSWLFWDTDPAKIDLKANGRYVIERVLETGGFEEFSWIQKVYPTRLIMETCEISRKVSPKSKNFWRVWFDEGAY